MPNYIVNLNIHLNVNTEVNAPNEEQAREIAKQMVFNGCYEPGDLQEDPVVNWLELDED